MQKRLMLFKNSQRDLIKSKYTNLSGGHWITVTKQGPMHGKHLYIDDNGVILAGKVPKEFHGKKLSELHHMDVASHDKKEDEVIKRPLPDKTPYLSKKPIHNTYSKKSPAELKAIITQAKANIKANGGNGWDKKVIAVASYYLNGGEKPDDSAFGSKKQKDVPQSDKPHPEESYLHDSTAKMTAGQLDEQQNMLLTIMDDAHDLSSDQKADIQKQLDIVHHHMKEKGFGKDIVQSQPPKADSKQAPHMDKENYHNMMSEMDESGLNAAISTLTHKMNGLKDKGAEESVLGDLTQKKLDIANYYKDGGKKPDFASHYEQKAAADEDGKPHPEMVKEHNHISWSSEQEILDGIEDHEHSLKNGTLSENGKKNLDILKYYASKQGLLAEGQEQASEKADDNIKEDPEPENVDPKETVPHKGKYPLTHKAVEDGDKIKIKEKQADLTSQMHTHISNENKEYHGVAKEKLEVVNHYAKHHGATVVEAPDYESSVAENKKNKQAAQSAQQKQHQAVLDDFHNPSHVIQSTNHEHHGKDIKDFGIDYKNSDHVHAWHKKIDHDAKGDSKSDLESRAYKMTELIKEGDHHTGKTNGNDSTAKAKVEKNLGLALANHDHFLQLARRVGSAYGLPSDNSKLTKEQREKLSRSAVDNIVRKWARTSADHDALAIAVQLATVEEFGLEATSDTFSADAKQAAHDTYLKHPEIKSGIKAFLREQYNQTQAWFKTQGISHVPIMRGMGMKNEKALGHVPLNTPTKTKMGLQPISSFSSSSDTAHSFTSMSSTGGGGPYKVIIGAMIPVERILGCPQTGYGCMGEKELIVLGGGKELDNVVAYRWNNGNKEGFHHSDMFKHMSELSGAEVSTPEPGTKAPKAPPTTKKTNTEYHVKTTSGYKPATNAKHVINDHGMDLFVHKLSNGYKVNEGSTGLGITMTYKTQKAAIAAAHSKLASSQSLESIKTNIANSPKHSEQMTKSLIKNSGGVLYPDHDLENADWTKQSWDLPPYGSPEFDKWLKDTGTDLEHFKKTPVYAHMMQKKMKKSEDEGYHKSARYAYNTYTKDPIYLPVNRIKTPYQTHEATNEDKVTENVERIKNGDALSPVVIGYDYDLHDGHHRLEAAKRVGHTHVPCIVGGRNPRRVEAAKKRYRGIWKSAAISLGRLLVKKAEPAKSDEHWVTISGARVLINGHGDIIHGPEGLKTHTAKKKLVLAPKKQPEAWESKKLTPYDTKEIVEAREKAKTQVPTHARSYYHSPERKKLRNDIAKELYGDGAKNKNRRVDIVIGPPAAGKSTVFADPLAKEHGSLIIDSDMAKERLPEFDGGNGAGIVHEESAHIIEGLGGVFHRALKNGDNMVLPLVGRGTNKLVQLRDQLKQAGYEVHLHLNELPKEKATQRAVARFYSHGRFVDPDYVHNVVGDKPSQVYENLKKIGGFHSYEKYSNDVEKGQKPKIIEQLNHKGQPLEKSSRREIGEPFARDTATLSGEQGSGRRSGDGTGLAKSLIDRVGRLLLKK